MAEVRVYTCPDGVTRTLDPLLRDCPETTAKANVAGAGLDGRARSRFLGSRGRVMSAAEAAKLLPYKEQSGFGEPDRRFVWWGLAAIVVFLLLFRRRKGKS